MKKLILPVIAIILIACSNPLDKKFNKETAKEDFKTLGLDSADNMLLAGALVKLTLEQEDLTQMTYRDILEYGKNLKDEQEKKKAEEKALAEAAAKAEEERVKKLYETADVTVVEKGFYSEDHEWYVSFGFAVDNKVDKNIEVIEGNIVFSDLQDNEIKRISFDCDKPVAGHETINWTESVVYNKFIDSDVILKDKELKDLKVTWIPKKIVFEGERVEYQRVGTVSIQKD